MYIYIYMYMYIYIYIYIHNCSVFCARALGYQCVIHNTPATRTVALSISCFANVCIIVMCIALPAHEQRCVHCWSIISILIRVIVFFFQMRCLTAVVGIAATARGNGGGRWLVFYSGTFIPFSFFFPFLGMSVETFVHYRRRSCVRVRRHRLYLEHIVRRVLARPRYTGATALLQTARHCAQTHVCSELSVEEE